MTDLRFDIQKMRRAFNRAAQTYDAAAVVPAEIRARALERLQVIRNPPNTILDLGAGTGGARARLAQHFPHAWLIELDSALQMLKQQPQRRGWRSLFPTRRTAVAADAAALPLKDKCIDWVFSNLMLPWCSPLDNTLTEVQRVLKPGGAFHFTSLGPDTLIELRNAWPRQSVPPLLPFLDMHDIGDALVRAGFADPVLDVERITVTYGDLSALLHELKKLGSCNPVPENAARVTRRTLQQVRENYTRSGDRFPVTVEVIFGQAWRSDRPQVAHADEVRIPIGSIRRRQ